MTEQLNEIRKKYHEAIQALENTLLARIQVRLSSPANDNPASKRIKKEVKEEIKAETRGKVDVTKTLSSQSREFHITRSEPTVDAFKQQSRIKWKRWVFSAVVVTLLFSAAALIWFFQDHPALSPYLESISTIMTQEQ